MKVVISGSRSIQSLNAEARTCGPAVSGESKVRKRMKSRIDKVIELNAEIFIGDAYGIDSLVQAYLYKRELAARRFPSRAKFVREKDYHKVTVWYSRILRNNIGNWKTVNVPGGYTKRDIAMHSQADYGLAIWDGKSRENEILNR
ncbi:hypothetical protein M595_1213 [Lyngbya aestuarii BL J]|uniref:Uncharacterized protein n=1 Tax=Lyngbya aestuarii BL J TaxID=1348334 RepID=U7QLJ5_9CYAN|nr:hypothetical protein [Lyngbya aestuarii]ERT08758.1 hypothetical protein M595_1213 [Lyngbya aestuarii BL J]